MLQSPLSTPEHVSSLQHCRVTVLHLKCWIQCRLGKLQRFMLWLVKCHERLFGTRLLVIFLSRAHPFGHQLGTLLPALIRWMIRSSRMGTSRVSICYTDIRSIFVNKIASLHDQFRLNTLESQSRKITGPANHLCKLVQVGFVRKSVKCGLCSTCCT